MGEILKNNENKILIFTKTKAGADQLAFIIGREMKIRAGAIHGDVAQHRREDTLAQFRHGRIRVLVATDVASRGIDINDITHVINFDMPNTVEDYVHRIGRTARGSNSKGVAVTFFSHDDSHLAAKLVQVLDKAKQEVEPELRDLSFVRNNKQNKNYNRFNGSTVWNNRQNYGEQRRARQQSWGYDGGQSLVMTHW